MVTTENMAQLMAVSLFTNLEISHLSFTCTKWGVLQMRWYRPSHISVKNKRLSTHWKCVKINPPDIYIFDLFQQDMIKMSLGKFYCWWKAEDDSPWGRFAEHTAHRLCFLSSVKCLSFPPTFFFFHSSELSSWIMKCQSWKGLNISFSRIMTWNTQAFKDAEPPKTLMCICIFGVCSFCKIF